MNLTPPSTPAAPYSEIARASIHDTDARMGEVLDAVDRAGVTERTAFFVVADHGMEDSNPDVPATGPTHYEPPACPTATRPTASSASPAEPG